MLYYAYTSNMLIIMIMLEITEIMNRIFSSYFNILYRNINNMFYIIQHWFFVKMLLYSCKNIIRNFQLFKH